MKAIDLFFDDQVNSLMTSFSYCFKVHLTIFPLDLKRPLETGFYTEHCAYCKLIRGQLGREPDCSALDREMCARSEKCDAPLPYTCHAGLVDAALPLRMNGQVVGYAMAGQFRVTGAAPPPGVSREWRDRGFDPAVLDNAFREQPRFEKAEVDNMLNLFSMLCAFIVSRDYIRLRHIDIVRLVTQWIDDHVAEPVMLEDVARHLGYSQSSISHIIKLRTGKSFKELCVTRKIERFERAVTADPSLTVEKAAAMAGYDDPCYFSRLYKRVRGVTPSVFVKTARQGDAPPARAP